MTEKSPTAALNEHEHIGAICLEKTYDTAVMPANAARYVPYLMLGSSDQCPNK